MSLPTLRNTGSPLADTAVQRAALNALPLRSFDEALAAAHRQPLCAESISLLQINLGRRCNQACRHCHVDAGPDRTEMMPDAVIDACVRFVESAGIETVDLTGGAPELHPRFRDLVIRLRQLCVHVMDRCNLTITRLPNYADLPEFLAANDVEVAASLPSISQKQTDAQRGNDVFDASIMALRRFNVLGYGIPGSGLVLNLITNPVGAFLSAPQRGLEADWKRELLRRYGVYFNRLLTITNMPINRYLEFLVASGNLEAYMERLVAAFNPAAVPGLMCRTMLSVGWDGRLYDCDFNQMVDAGVAPDMPQTIFDADAARLATRRIAVGQHCFGCTAGWGSSCGGATVRAG